MKKKVAKKLSGIVSVSLLAAGSIYWLTTPSSNETAQQKQEDQKPPAKKKSNEANEMILDVPLANQFDEPALENGCEVTALSMLLNYYGFETTKNLLANELTYVPVFNEDGTHGDPNEGFVGDISGGDWAMGVYVAPIAALAQKVVHTSYHAQAKKEASLADIKEALNEEKPVWTIVTIEFEVPDETDFMTWTTQNGEVSVTPLVHACVVTGYDKEMIYVNDPYGEKNRAVPIDDFTEIFEAMGGQMLTLEKSN